MFATLFGSWPSHSSHHVNAERSNAQSSGLDKRSTFGGEDEPPSASSTFVLRPENFPSEKVFIPPYFVPPGGYTNDHRTQDVAERLQDALQRDAAATERTGGPTPVDNPNDSIDPGIRGLRPLAPKELELPPSSKPAEPQAGAQLDQVTHSPSPAAEPADLQREREANWSDSARQAFHAMIAAPGYVNRYRLTPAKYRRLLSYLQHPDVEPTNEDGSKDHQTKYQAANWVLRNGKLYRKAESKAGSGGGGLRRHLDAYEVWHVLTAEHLRSQHLGRDRLRKKLERKFIGYTLQEIMFVLRECKRCKSQHKGSTDLETDRERSLEHLGPAQDYESTNRQENVQESPSVLSKDPYGRKQSSNLMWF